MLPLLFLPLLVSSSPLTPLATPSRPLAPIFTPSPPSVLHHPSFLFANAHNLSSTTPSSPSHLIPNGYIVRLSKDVSFATHSGYLSLIRAEEANFVGAYGGETLEGLEKIYDFGKEGKGGKGRGFRGYAGKFSEREIERIRGLEGVEYVERDSIVLTRDLKDEQQKFSTWGLHRISHRAPIKFQTLIYGFFATPAPSGVNAYIIDTGINIKHVELEGRAEWGHTMPKNDVDEDSNGHGSHVAGTIGSNRYGVHKSATLIAVKVLGSNGQGTMSDVIGGVEWAVNDMERRKSKKGYKGSVANMSLGGGKSQALDDVVDAAVEEGMHFAVAAGNDNRDACSYSPAASKLAITVGASTLSDEIAYFSNHGKCVDVFAPGLDILSIWNTGNRSVNKISGTSMASPHVAGLAAYFLSVYPEKFDVKSGDFTESVYEKIENPLAEAKEWIAQLVLGWVGRTFRFTEEVAPTPKKPEEITPKQLKDIILKLSTKDALKTLPANTPNLLIYNNYTAW